MDACCLIFFFQSVYFRVSRYDQEEEIPLWQLPWFALIKEAKHITLDPHVKKPS